MIGVLMTLIAGIAPVTGAQWGVWQADSLLAAGRIQPAESAYYAAVRRSPRDPSARAALGRYLAARGAPRVGAVLLEEARQFGGDSATLATALSAMYARARDYASLAALRPVVVSEAVRRRALWLADNPTIAHFRDTIAVLTYSPLGDGRGIGTVLMRIGRSELPAIIDPRTFGVQMPTGSTGIRAFGRDGAQSIGVLRSFRIGGVEFTNVPVAIGARDEPLRVGLDVLAGYDPTFDPVAGLLTLRRVDRRTRAPDGVRVPALYDSNGLRVLIGGQWYPSTSAAAAMLLASRRWTWDDRRGDVLLLGER